MNHITQISIMSTIYAHSTLLTLFSESVLPSSLCHRKVQSQEKNVKESHLLQRRKKLEIKYGAGESGFMRTGENTPAGIVPLWVFPVNTVTSSAQSRAEEA